MTARRGWFSDVGNDEEDKLAYHKMWQPCLELGSGYIPCFDVWFATEAECDNFIKTDILGQPFLPMKPTSLPEPDEVASLIPWHEPIDCNWSCVWHGRRLYPEIKGVQ